ncbi:E3 ubiquitin-protein ligase BOI-like [Primulina huaijiensis]|uniref:E3 ubiquitin-protein ligase BOI-like n=1 Tax=Primulina huaijiensis TaxID=1492673 RepID=UPI003CC74AB1
MIIKNGVPKDLRKRKMKGVAEEPSIAQQQMNLFNLQGQQRFASPSIPVNDGHRSRVQQILNTAAPAFKPFSSTSWGAFVPFISTPSLDSIADKYPLSIDVIKRRNDNQIDQIITAHEVNLRHALGGMLSEHHRITHDAAEERVTEKLRERELELQENMNKNLELKEMASHYKAEKEKVHDRVKFLEQVTKSLQYRLRDAVEARRYAETPQDDAQSSFTDPDRVRPVKLECKVCEERVAMVMMWPCRHVCVCVQCDAAVKECPVCGSVKRTSVEVCIPA